MTYPAGTVLFAVTDDADALGDARAYIARYNLNQDDVRIGKTRAGMLVVETKREVELA